MAAFTALTVLTESMGNKLYQCCGSFFGYFSGGYQPGFNFVNAAADKSL